MAMRTRIVLAAGIGLALASSAFSATSPIVAYNFDEGSGTTLVDQSGNNHDGTLVNGPRWTSGVHGGGLSFDGFNDYVRIGDLAQLDGLRALTVSAWVKFATAGGGANEIHFVDKSGCNGYTNSGPWELGVALTQPHKAEFVIYPQGGQPSTYLFSGASRTSVDDGNWHFISGRYDGNALSIWVDGVQENAKNYAGLTTTSSSYRLELGGHCSNGTPYQFAGQLDDVRVYDRALSSGEINTDMTTPVASGSSTSTPPPQDSTPPSTPTGLQATSVTSTQVAFAWQASADNVGVAGYKIVRDGAQIATSTSTSYTDAGRNPSTTYAYEVFAYDAAGNTSSRSNAITVTTASGSAPPPPPQDTTPPSTPTGLQATSVTSTEVAFAWQASTDNVGVVGYKIFRDGAQIATSTNTSYTDSGRNPNTTYSYIVSAYDAAGNGSGTSNAITVTTTGSAPPPPPQDTTPPSVPTGLRTTNVTATQVTLAWQASTDNVGVAGYRVFRNGAQIATSSATNYTDAGLTSNTNYSYSVLAYDAAGNVSARSSPLSVTTASSGSTPGYTTNFSSSENPLSEGGKWITGKTTGLDWNNPVSASGKAYASVESGATGSRYDDNIAHLNPSFQTFNANQYAQATVYLVSGYSGARHEAELLLRFSISGHDAHGYEILWGLPGYMAVVRWDGPLGYYTAIYDPGTGSIPVPRDGDVFRAEINGNIITVKVNGNTVATVDVSSVGSVWSSGQPGIGFWPVDGAIPQNYGWRSFQAGNL